MNRKDELVMAIRRHNYRYFVEHAPEISDAEFDVLVEALRALDPAAAVLREIGSDLTGDRASVTHTQPMLSLEKCYTIDDLTAWAHRFTAGIIASPKIDGVAIAIRYDAQGHLTCAATRGDGHMGEDVTANARCIKGIVPQLSLQNVEIRGEVFLPLSTFEARFAADFANPRNLAAGAMKQKDPRKTADYGLHFFAYDLVGSACVTETAKRAALEAAGVPVVAWQVVTREALEATCASLRAACADYDFETDGVVFKLDEVQAQEAAGSTAHHPRFAMALKFQGEAATTTLDRIEWSVSRTGTITPVGIVQPVTLSGATITRVSLHNYGHAKALGVGEGARVEIRRRGGVIPHLESVQRKGKREIAPPRRCPACGGAVTVDGDFVLCANPSNCQTARVGALKHFLDAIGCEGFGPKVLEQLVDRGMVHDPADLYALTVDDLLTLERMGEVLAAKLIDQLAQHQSLPLEVFLRGLGIPELARQTSRALATFGSLDRIFALTAEELQAIDGIGPQIASAVLEGLQGHRSRIDKLQQYVTITRNPAPVAGGRLVGKSVLFTGTLIAMDRQAARRLVEEQGGEVASGVSRHLDYLVVGDAGRAGSKLAKAETLVAQGEDLTILTETAFFTMVQ